MALVDPQIPLSPPPHACLHILKPPSTAPLPPPLPHRSRQQPSNSSPSLLPSSSPRRRKRGIVTKLGKILSFPHATNRQPASQPASQRHSFSCGCHTRRRGSSDFAVLGSSERLSWPASLEPRFLDWPASERACLPRCCL
ncbi:hypothetical protein VPH35_017340 [Triticum aestivum]